MGSSRLLRPLILLFAFSTTFAEDLEIFYSESGSVSNDSLWTGYGSSKECDNRLDGYMMIARQSVKRDFPDPMVYQLEQSACTQCKLSGFLDGSRNQDFPKSLAQKEGAERGTVLQRLRIIYPSLAAECTCGFSSEPQEVARMMQEILDGKPPSAPSTVEVTGTVKFVWPNLDLISGMECLQNSNGGYDCKMDMCGVLSDISDLQISCDGDAQFQKSCDTYGANKDFIAAALREIVQVAIPKLNDNGNAKRIMIGMLAKCDMPDSEEEDSDEE